MHLLGIGSVFGLAGTFIAFLGGLGAIAAILLIALGAALVYVLNWWKQTEAE